MLRFENKAKKEGYQFILGVDEAGRGPLAGPVVASAVALKTFQFYNKIDDSKKLSAPKREKAFLEIYNNAYVGIGIVNERIIDSVNILEATYFAMSQAIQQLILNIPSNIYKRKIQKNTNILILVDGNKFKTDLPYSYQTVIKGDMLSLSIACASIIAKVTRDRILRIYDQVYPEYGFSHHKGYPTKAHKNAIKNYGLSFIHRKSFKHDRNI